MGKRQFYLSPSLSPLVINLRQQLSQQGWVETDSMLNADFSSANLMLNDDRCEQLEYKHLLAQLINEYCPHISPYTEIIDDENWHEVFKVWSKENIISPKIIKPSKRNNGEAIKILSNPDELAKHYRQYHRYSGKHVLQNYITNPHLLASLNSYHKYSIRVFLVLNNAGRFGLFPEGYFNIAKQPYHNNYQDVSAHITNEHLSFDTVNVIQVPTDKFKWFREFFPSIMSQTKQLIEAWRSVNIDSLISSGCEKFTVFGLDFMIDADKRCWFIEANHCPCFPTNNQHPLYDYLYVPFWKWLINEWV